MSSEADRRRVALVTGAARGIGAATVRRLLALGYRVTAVDSCSADKPPAGIGYALATQAELAEVGALSPDEVLPLVVDVRSRAELATAVATTLARFGRLDAVVAAAGVVAGGQAQWQTPDEHMHAMMDVNVVGVWNTAAETVPAMLATSSPTEGRFVAIASAAAERGLYGLSAYSASKHAVVGIVRSLAADLVGTGVTAVAVSPGATRTPMLSATALLYGDVEASDLARQQGLRRLLEPEEIADTVAWCCSPQGAALNGSIVRAEGGFGL